MRPMIALAVGLVTISFLGRFVPRGSVHADSAASGSTIKKRTGQIVTGQIKGILIQGETGDVKDEAARGHGALYYRVPGADIVAIDEEGVNLRPDSHPRYILCGRKDALNEIAILEAFHKIEEGGTNVDFIGLAFGVGCVQVDSRKVQTPIKLRLRGEFRMEGNTGKLIPAIEVITAAGNVNIPVEEIVAFKRIGEK
jgi:hypothetical protein